MEMVIQDLVCELSVKTETKIIMLIIDGLGGLWNKGKSELEFAQTKNLDKLAKVSSCGLIQPIAVGITPGSGPAHLALFGYDPIKYQIGRGILEVLGIDFPITEIDVAARGNLATLDKEGKITDRRAGRIPTEKTIELCKLLNKMKIDDVEVFVQPVKEHRVAVIFRGNDLDDSILDVDPQKEGLKLKEPLPLTKKAEKLSKIVSKFIENTKQILTPHYPANILLLRGFSKHPKIPTFSEIYKLTPAAIAVYPMYKGIARLVGMEILEAGNSITDEIDTLSKNYNNYDFFYIHIKKTDSSGEDGDFNSKVKVIEEVDSIIPDILKLNPDVLVVTGDHSTPSHLKGHSWHPVPILLHSKFSNTVNIEKFCERECLRGSLGIFSTIHLMTLAMANALKLKKFGA